MRKSIDVSLSPDALPTADVLPLPETDATKADAELPELRTATKVRRVSAIVACMRFCMKRARCRCECGGITRVADLLCSCRPPPNLGALSRPTNPSTHPPAFSSQHHVFGIQNFDMLNLIDGEAL